METLRSRDGFAYWGESEGWFIAYQAANCNGLLDKANLEAFRRALPEGSYHVESFGGGLRGVSIETLLIDPERADAVTVADSILAELEDYPVIDDELYSEMEYEDALDSCESACTDMFGSDDLRSSEASGFILAYASDEGAYIGEDFWPTERQVFFGYLRYRRAQRDRATCASLRATNDTLHTLQCPLFEASWHPEDPEDETVRADRVREAEHASEREDFASLGCEDCQSAIDREVQS